MIYYVLLAFCAILFSWQFAFNKIYQKIYEQNLKLNEIDDKLDGNELREIASLRVIDNTSMTPQEQAAEWRDCYITLQIAYLTQEREKVKNDIVKVQSIIVQIKKLEAEKKSVNKISEEN